ncbi:carbon-nitrogen hydrolase family protein [Arthrobacter cryoconiti]|uniref:Carbon-nitrogen hydrolase family protein n=1 Tax=Arthrobacter cryoconiti TaxID=748907 RepID=A0ABV8R0Y0_9MICC|nr:carbon-nitrogen hydrolase family protein [Arthrobacter cryoconiti]MCC9067579.1 carbon-nitrogen hydrolase family protein [Arthrobacter cryoconiti]
MHIALGQLASGADVGANLQAIDRFAAQAASRGARLIAFPEYATYEKKMVDATFPTVAQPLDGQIGCELAKIAKRHEIALVSGFVESSPDPARAFNTLVAFGPDGALLAAYRKVHLFDAQGFEESRYVAPAPTTDPVTFCVDGVRFGLLTCYDLRFPEQAQSLSDAGSQVLLVCSSWVPGESKMAQWRTLLAARAIENSLYVAGSCQAPPVSVGHSLLADPMGGVVAELGVEVGLVTAEVCVDTVADVRKHFPTSVQRRIEWGRRTSPPT